MTHPGGWSRAGSDGDPLAEAGAGAAAGRALLPHDRGVRASRAHPGLARRDARRAGRLGRPSSTATSPSWTSRARPCGGSIAAAYPDAPVLLSTRSSTDAWWRSASSTILAARPPGERPSEAPWQAMVGSDVRPDRRPRRGRGRLEGGLRAPQRRGAGRGAGRPAHRVAARGRLGARCAPASASRCPSEPFPHTNTTADFRTMTGLDQQ